MKNIRIKSIQQANGARTKKAATKKPAQKPTQKTTKKDKAEDFFKEHEKVTPKQTIKEERAKIGVFKTLLVLVFAFIAGIIGNIVAQQYFFPWLLTHPSFENVRFIQQATQQTTIINTTSEVVTEEGEDAIPTAIAKAAPSIVGIYENDEYRQSGMILTNDGLIITSSQNITKDKTFTVKTRKGNEHEADILDINTNLKLALLRIDAENLPVITLADTEGLETGEFGIALHHQVNAKNAISAIPTYISSLQSVGLEDLASQELLASMIDIITISNSAKEYDFLVNTKGELTGIQLQGLTKNETVTSFVNISSIRDIMTQATKGQKLGYPSIGFQGIIVTEEIQKSEDLNSDRGYLITYIDAEGPAAEAELELNDIILEIDKEEILPSSNITEILRKYSAGDIIEMKVLRAIEDGEDTTERLSIELVLE